MSARLCECGCGEVAPIVLRARTSRGLKKGDQLRFVPFHHARLPSRSRLRITESDYTAEDKGCATPCWIVKKGVRADGYARMMYCGRRRYAHVAMYEQEVGAVPEGMEVDHLCRERACVNPWHLEAVTPSTNARRSLRHPAHSLAIDKKVVGLG